MSCQVERSRDLIFRTLTQKLLDFARSDIKENDPKRAIFKLLYIVKPISVPSLHGNRGLPIRWLCRSW